MSRPFRFVWLAIVVVVLAVVLWPARQSQFPPVRFLDVTAAAGIHFTHTNGATGRKLLPETMGAGVAVLDYDGDGRPDLFFVNGRSWPGDPGPRSTQALFRNRGDGTFEDVTDTAGLDVELFGMGVTVADFDGDGRPDLFVTAVGGNKLFRNLDGKRFEDATETTGVGGPGRWPQVSGDEFRSITTPIPFPSSATWLDYDNDGRPDLFVCYYLTWSPATDLAIRAVLPNGVRAYVPPTQFPAADCVLYRNIDGKRFEDVSLTTGIRVESGPVAKPLGVVASDPDRDGFPDLLVACDTTRNLFFHNQPGPTGRRFVESGLSANVAYADGRPRGGMGIDAAELMPGGFTAVIANFSNEPNTLLDLRRSSPLGFVDAAPGWGLAGPSRGPMKFGALFFDYDADGRPDLFTANGHLEPDIASTQPGQSHAQAAQLFRNTGDPQRPWTEVAGSPDLFAPMVGRGCAVLDYDGDGFLDLVVTANGGPARLLRNDNTTGNRVLRLDLVGMRNRDALGAEVRVEAGGRKWTQTRLAARGYLSQSDRTLSFGLGKVNRADRVVVRWPGGAEQIWDGLDAGRYRLVEGEPTAERR